GINNLLVRKTSLHNRPGYSRAVGFPIAKAPMCRLPARVAKLGAEIMPAQARTIAFEMHWPEASEPVGGHDHETLNRGPIHLADRHSLFVASTGDDESLI